MRKNFTGMLLGVMMAALLALPMTAYAEGGRLWLEEPTDTDPGVKNIAAIEENGTRFPGAPILLNPGEQKTLVAYMRDGYLFGFWTITLGSGDGATSYQEDLREFDFIMPDYTDGSVHVSATANTTQIGDQKATLNGSILTWEAIDGYSSRVVIRKKGSSEFSEKVSNENTHEKSLAASEFTEAGADRTHSADISRALRIEENRLLQIIEDEDATGDDVIYADRALEALNGEHEIAISYGKPDGKGSIQEQGRKTTACLYTYTTGNTRLAAPTELSWNDGFTANWSTVEKAAGYEVIFYEKAADGQSSEYGSVTVGSGNTTSCKLTDVQGKNPTEGAQYTFTVTALYDDDDYLPSAASSPSDLSDVWSYPVPQAPDISVQPQSASCERNSTAAPLTVTASTSDGAALSYQWYSNTTDATSGGTLIQGAEGSSYTPPTNTEGVTWYYCVVTAASEQGEMTSVTTDAARIEVATYYDVWVAGIRVSSLNAHDVLGDADPGATVIYDMEKEILKLENADIQVVDKQFAIYAEQDLIIALSGTNSVTLTGQTEVGGPTWGAGDSTPAPAAAIACKGGSLTVQNGKNGNGGSLTATNEAEVSYTGDSGAFMIGGIVATGTVSIKHAEITATASYAEGDNNDVVSSSYGIYAGKSVTADDAKVTAESEQACKSAGIYAQTDDIILNGDVTASGGRAIDQLNPSRAISAGICAGEGAVNIGSGTIRAYAGSLSEHGEAYGICGYESVTITGGKVFAGGTGSNMDGVDPTSSAGIFSIAGNVVISGKDTFVEADGGYAEKSVIGIGARAGDVSITDANVKIAAQYFNTYDDGIAVGIYVGSIDIARNNSGTGNIIFTGGDIHVIGLTDPMRYSGSLTVVPTEGMKYSVDALEQILWDYPDLLWKDMATAAQGIQGSPFAKATSIDHSLIAGNQYLHFYNEGTESESDPDSAAAANKGADSQNPQTGDSSPIVPLALALGFALVIGIVALIRKKEC